MNKEFFEHMLGRLKIFWLSFVLVFLVVSLQYLGLHAPSMMPFISTKLQAIFHPIQQTFPTPPLNTQAVNTKEVNN